MEQIATGSGLYWIIGLAFTVGCIVGLWLSAYQNPLAGPALLEDIKKRRIAVEQIYYRWCLIRSHQVEAEDHHEQYIRDCSNKNFANRVYRLYQNYDEELRGGQRWQQIMTSAKAFDLDYTRDPRRLEADVIYQKTPTPPNEWD
jgi:hypothetical protein